MPAKLSDSPSQRLVEIEKTTNRKPRVVDRLRDWEYLERQHHRLLCAWGRFFHEWNDIVAVNYQVWEAAECVRRLRERLLQFPGHEANLGQPVSRKLEVLVNTVLQAPTHEDAIDGIYGVLGRAMSLAYAHYATAAHPIHDAPTLELINEVMTIREKFRLWMREYRRRNPHITNSTYAEAIARALADCGDLLLPQAATPDDPAQPVGIRAEFLLPEWPARPAGSKPGPDIMTFIRADFQTSVETRRLFWCIGYMRELNLAMDQLRWLWDTPYMPWGFHHDISRHLWDESRHGDSGYSRMLDFGLELGDVGLGSYGEESWDDRPALRPHLAVQTPGAFAASGATSPRTAAEMYDQVWQIGMIAETVHFTVKREAYEDFKAGGDFESAEMMLFDIIDEQTHVQYAHRWLPVLAEHGHVPHAGYKERAAERRKELIATALEAVDRGRAIQRDPSDPGFVLYQRLLNQMRVNLPLANARDDAPRSVLPM